MELIARDSIFEFNSDTLHYLRKQYDLDKPGRIEEAINLLDDWVQKQPHFMKKDFERDYLERTIILSKGSVERAKKKLDSICRFRTVYHELFAKTDIKNFNFINDMYCAFLPKLTEDHYRIYLLKNRVKTAFDTGFADFFNYFFMQCEYIQAHDYCNGVVFMIDYEEANVMETFKMLNINELQTFVKVLKEGYGMRVKGFHFLMDSKAIDVIISIFKQAFSGKIGKRVMSHRNVDTLYNYIPKDIFPVDYGGKEKPLLELHKQFQDILTSKDFTEYMAEMKKACTNEDLRQNDDECYGVPGSFRKLNVD